jgi:hypothetical protein
LKKIKHIVSLFLIFSMSVYLVYLFWQFFQSRQTSHKNENIIIEAMLNARRLEAGMDGLQLDPTISLYNSAGDSIPLGHLVNSNEKLILYFSQSACDLCVDHAFRALQTVHDIVPEKIAVVVSYSSYRDFYIYQKSHNYPWTFYNRGNRLFGLSAETVHMPCFFVLERNLTIRSAFIPLKEIPVRSKLCLDALAAHL